MSYVLKNMTIVRALTALLLAVLLLPANASPAAACSCLAQTPEEQLAQAEVVFTGRVAAVDRPAMPPTVDPVTYRFDVTRVLKGSVASNVSVQTAADSAMCGVELGEVGTTATVFGRYVDGQLHTGLCDGTHQGEPDPSLVGAGTVLPPQSDGGPPSWAIVAISAAVVALVVFIASRRRISTASA